MVLLDTGTPGTSREIYSEDADIIGVPNTINVSTVWNLKKMFMARELK